MKKHIESKLINYRKAIKRLQREYREKTKTNIKLMKRIMELKERIKCYCFDPKVNNNRCVSYNRIAEDYEKDLRKLNSIKNECEKILKDAVTQPISKILLAHRILDIIKGENK